MSIHNPVGRLEEICRENIPLCYGSCNQRIEGRLKYELKQYSGSEKDVLLLLSTHRLCDYAREKGILTGSGRGAITGSIVAYLLGITKIDPLKYDLIFERFYNTDGISSIYIDCDSENRDRLSAYVEEEMIKASGIKPKIVAILPYNRLSQIKEILTSITKNADSFLAKIPLDDKRTFEWTKLNLHYFLGTSIENEIVYDFQRLGPETVEDLALIRNIFRCPLICADIPGELTRNKKGVKPIYYICPELQEVLKDTYGLIVYQEQVMRILNSIFGFAIYDAVSLTMKSKCGGIDPNLLIAKAVNRGFSVEKATIIAKWLTSLEYLPGLKAHYISYALMDYWYAYLTINYVCKECPLLKSNCFAH